MINFNFSLNDVQGRDEINETRDHSPRQYVRATFFDGGRSLDQCNNNG